jgi:hypothetical protein
MKSTWSHILLLFAFLVLLGFFFAQVEIQIEGPNGWASALPTWRIEHHPLLNIFWGGRAMTGYHLWIFSFMALVFHLPLVICRTFNWKLEARILGSVTLFWIIEDFLWFVMNPDFGLERFEPSHVPWHKCWICGMPSDYIVFTVVGVALIVLSFRERKT